MVILFALLSLLAITNGQEGIGSLISAFLLINITCIVHISIILLDIHLKELSNNYAEKINQNTEYFVLIYLSSLAAFVKEKHV